MQCFNHILELDHLGTIAPSTGIARIWGKKTDGIIAPVVDTLPVDQIPVVHKVVHRHKL